MIVCLRFNFSDATIYAGKLYVVMKFRNLRAIKKPADLRFAGSFTF